MSIICLGGPSLHQVPGSGPMFTVGVKRVGLVVVFCISRKLGGISVKWGSGMG